VTIRGDHDEEIFKDAQDYQAYLDLLKKYKTQYGFKLFAFVLLPNHLLLLAELKERIILSDIMHDLNGNYTKYFNRKYGLKGHLFRERYQMNLIEKSQYLAYMSAYIHLYPQELSWVPEFVIYPYSSYPAYLYYAGFKDDCPNIKPESFGFDMEMKEEIMEVLRVIEGNYVNYLRDFPTEEIKIFAKNLKKNKVLGSEEFRETVRLKIEAYWREKYLREMNYLRHCISNFENDDKNSKELEKSWDK
jgi:REP element-mobilizing transposase RayT